MTLHEKADRGLLKDEDFSKITPEIMNDRDRNGNTVWHVAASWCGFEGVPKDMFTEEVLNQKDTEGRTVWQKAAFLNNLGDIPPHLFTEQVIAHINETTTLFKVVIPNKTSNVEPAVKNSCI